MEFLYEYGLFLAKIVTLLAAVAALLIIIKLVGSKHGSAKGELEIINLTDKHQDNLEYLEDHIHDDAYLKARHKAEKKQEKEEHKQSCL